MTKAIHFSEVKKCTDIPNGDGTKIGFFDSGLGGVVVMHSVIAVLPTYDFEFYGDTANLPYGDKTEEEIFRLTKKGVEHLFNAGCILVIIACNTASAETLRRLQDEWLPVAYANRKILGVIIPMVEEVIASGEGDVVLIATTRTIGSRKYEREFEKFAAAPKLICFATPELAPLIELGRIAEAVEKTDDAVGEEVRDGYALILGCTHYALLTQSLREKYGSNALIFSPTEIIPRKLAEFLKKHSEIEQMLSRGGTQHMHLTDGRENYHAVISGLQANSL